MRKSFLILVLLFSFFMIVGCNNDPVEDDTYPEDTHLDMNNIYHKEWKEFVDSLIPDNYQTKISLPTEYEFSDGTLAGVVWESSNPQSISTRGLYMGNILDDHVKLTSNVTILNTSEYFNYYKYTFAKGIYTFEEYAKKVADIYIPDEVFADYDLITVEDKVFEGRNFTGTIKYTSSDESLFGSDGKYNTTSTEDETIMLSFVVEIRGFTVSGSKSVKVIARNDVAKINKAIEWLENEWYKNDDIISDMDLPKTDPKGMVTITWKSSDQKFADSEGHLADYKLNKEFIYTATVKMNDEVQTCTFDFKTVGEDKAVEYLLNRMHYDFIKQSYFLTFVTYPAHENTDYGYLNFFVQDLSESSFIVRESESGVYSYGEDNGNTNVAKRIINYGMAGREMTWKRPLELAQSVEFITVHDTGDVKFNAAQWANEVQTSSRSVSWHFTVDDKDIYQQIPIDECAWHAGDWPTQYRLIDTGVPYTVHKPEIVVNPSDGYFYINGIKSYLKAPYYDGELITTITPIGLFTTLGANGNYYIDDYHYDSTYKVIGNDGGNKNSVGIETCVVHGVEYSKVMRINANLVAHLLNHYNLDSTRVMQHRSFSGKLCPQSMIRADKETQFSWEEFMELVKVELFIIRYMKDIKLTYISNNPDLLDNQGNILQYVTEPTEVSYKVIAEWKGVTQEYTYVTMINPK